MLKHGILGLLNYGDMSGYEIKNIFGESLSHFWTAQTSQIYRELQVLEKEGWVISKQVAQKSRPDKRILSITSEGKEELKRWLVSEQQTNVRIPLLMKTFFRGDCSVEDNIAFFQSIEENSDVFPGGSEKARTSANQYAEMVGDSYRTLFWKFTIDFGLMYDEMLKKWCAKCIKELEDSKNGHPAD